MKGENVKDDPVAIHIGAMNVVDDLVRQLDDVVRSARSMPLSSSALVNREQVLEIIETLKRSLPEELNRARSILRDAEGVVERAKAEGQKLLDRVKVERERLLSKTDIVQAAAAESDRLVTAAESQARRIRAEAEEYVEGKLANFEVVLQKTLAAVERGRSRLAGRLEADQLAPDEEA